MMNNRNHYIFNFEEDSFPAVRPYTSFDSYESNSPPLSGSTYHDTDSVSEKSKIIRKKRNTYQKIDDESRIKLLDLVQQGETLKAAAKRYGINYSSAKSILHTFRKEGRILKKSAQERNARKRTKVASDLEMSPIYPYKTQDSYNETSEEQTYYSSDLKLKSEPSSMSGLTDEESPKIVSGITINSFGDFLKIESQSQKKSDKPAAKSPTSGFVFKFEPQYLQRNPSMEVKGGNWQLNLNVQRSVKSEEANPRVEAEPVLFEKFYSQCSDYSMEINKQMKREELENDAQFFQKRFETITDIITNADDYQIPQETNYDISCFLNSSPAYAFQPKMSDELDAGSYYNDYGTASSGVVKSAILRTC